MEKEMDWFEKHETSKAIEAEIKEISRDLREKNKQISLLTAQRNAAIYKLNGLKAAFKELNGKEWKAS